MRIILVWSGCFILTVLLLSGCGQTEPPRAKKIKKEFEHFGHSRVDNYYWLKERNNPEVLQYLEAENEYAEKSMAHTGSLQKELYRELTSRIERDEDTAPYFSNGYYYYTRYEGNKEYPIYCRKNKSLNASEEIMLDVNLLAKNHSYCRATGLTVSTDNRILAFGLDTLGRRKYIIHFKDLTSGKLFTERLNNTDGRPVWANDNETVFYTVKDHTLRPAKIMRHRLNTPPDTDVVVYLEQDNTFELEVQKSRSQKYIFIISTSTLSNEYQYLPADSSQARFSIFQDREADLEYHVQHVKNNFIIRTNYQANNFRIVKTSVRQPEKEFWQEVIPLRENVLVEDFTVFDRYLVVDERSNGLTRLYIMKWNDPEEGHYIHFEDAAYTAYIDKNPQVNSHILRFGYSSLTTPETIFDYEMENHEKVMVKQDQIPGGYNSENYRSERIFATANDRTLIPVSIVYRKDIDRTKPNYLYLV